MGFYYYRSNDIITQEALDVFEAIMTAYKSHKKGMRDNSTGTMNFGSYISWRGKIFVFPNICLYRKNVVYTSADTTMSEMMNRLIQMHKQEYPLEED